jgi:hypothetical protein
MAIPLIAMAVLGGVRMAAPHVAKYLAKQGFKKASATAVKKAPNAPKINMTQARNVASKPKAPSRKDLEGQGRISAGGKADDAIAAGISRAAKKKAADAARKKAADAARKKAAKKPQVSNVATKTVKPARKVSGAAKEELLKAAGKRASEVGKRMSKASDKKPGRGVAVRKTTQPTAPKTSPKARKTNQLPTTTKSKVPARTSKTPADKGRIVGLSGRGKKVAGGLAATAAAVALDQALKGGKSGKKPAEAGKLPSVQAYPRPVKKPPVPAKTKPKPKPVDSGRKKYNKGYETMKEYFIDDMSGRKSKVKTPFGMIDIDTSEKGMAMEEFDSKYGGQIKGTVKRRMGGQVRGYGKALRGY